VDDFANTSEGQSTVIDVLGNDSGAQPLSIVSTTPPAAGNVTVAEEGRVLIYTPRPGFVGTDNFTYTVQDGAGNTDTATVTVTVFPIIVFSPDMPTLPAVDFTSRTLTRGRTTGVSGSGFQPNEPVTLLALTRGGTAHQIGNVTADEQGNIQTDIQIPEALPTGNFTIRAIGQGGSQSGASRTIRIRNPR
jgi:hypothetical protein